MSEKTDDLLEALDGVVADLKASLPSEAPMFISHVNDPCRALVLREACFHRVTELAESAYDAFKKGNAVAGYLLARGIVETTALFWYFLDQVGEATKKKDLNKLRKILSRMLVGSKMKQAKEFGFELDPVNVLTLVQHVAEKHPAFERVYDFFSDIAHPNANGLIGAYVKLDRESETVYFGREHGNLAKLLEVNLETLIVTLKLFMHQYDQSAELFQKFQKMCEEDNPFIPSV